MVCVECGAVADEEARGWRAYRADLARDGEDDASAEDFPAVVYYCPACAAREFDTQD